MSKIMRNGNKYGGTASSMAKDIVYEKEDGTPSNVQGEIDELNKNLQWYIDNGFLLNPNDICNISIYNNRCQIVKNGCYVKNGICNIDLTIIVNIDADTSLNTANAFTLFLNLPQRRDSGMLTLKSDDGTFGVEDSRLFVSKCTNLTMYQITGWYYISN